MALSAKTGAFNTGTGALATTVVVTGVGFQPKTIIFWAVGRVDAVDAVGRRDHQRFIGVALSATERWAVASQCTDASAAGAGGVYHDRAACVATVSNAGAVTGLLDLQSMDSDGFTLVVDDVMPFDMRVHFLALGGADITNTKENFFALNTVTGNQAVTGVGFQPDFLLLVTDINNVDPPDGDTNSSDFSIGIASSATLVGTLGGVSDDGAATMVTDSYCTDAQVLSFLPRSGGNPDLESTLVSFDADGFTINISNASIASRVFYLALKGGRYVVGSLLTQTDTVTDIVETGFGFQPRAAMFFSHCKAKSTLSTAQAHDEWSVGAFDSITSRGAQGLIDVDAVLDAVISTAVEHDAVYVNIDTGTTPAVEGLMDIKSVDADGFTCIMDDADPAQAFVLYVAFGNSAAGPGGGGEPAEGGQPFHRRFWGIPGHAGYAIGGHIN